MKKLIYILLLFPLIGLVASCDDHLDDGGIHNAYVDQTTVDYLKGKNKFDTVLFLFEKAGLLDELNKKGNTIVIPTNYSVNRYVKQWAIKVRNEQNDENYKFNFDSLMVRFPLFKDSLAMYVVPREINRSDLEKATNYSIITQSLFGNDIQLSLQETELYTEWLPNSVPLLLHYKWVRNGLDPDDNASLAEEDKDQDNICQTSGIITKTGILHVLKDEHNLFYNQWKSTSN